MLRALRPPQPDTALVILVGITADARKRARIFSFFRERCGIDVYLPHLPYVLGLKASSLALRRLLKREMLPRRYRTVHFLNFIAGGFVFRLLHDDLRACPVGRVLYVRAPIQEEVPRAVVRRLTKLGVLLTRGKTMVDLASAWPQALPFPASHGEQGLMIETKASAIATTLGLTAQAVPDQVWEPGRLLPGAADMRKMPVSHDEVYEQAEALEEMLAFLTTGRFRT